MKRFNSSSCSEDTLPPVKRSNDFNAVRFSSGFGASKRFDSTQSTSDDDSKAPPNQIVKESKKQVKLGASLKSSTSSDTKSAKSFKSAKSSKSANSRSTTTTNTATKSEESTEPTVQSAAKTTDSEKGSDSKSPTEPVKTEPTESTSDTKSDAKTRILNSANCEMEYETYFALPVATHIGESIKKNIARIDLPHREVWVFYFKDGTRVTGTTSQRKHVLRKSRHLYLSGSIATPIVIPMCRTVSIEESVPFTASMSELSSMVQRFILYRSNNVRISLECRSNGAGNEYYISGEVEYSAETLNDFHGLRMREAELVCELRDTLCQYFATNIVSNIMCVLHRLHPATHDSVFKMPCRVFSKFHKVQIRDSKSFIYKHKYDGFKCKLVCTEPNKLLYQDDNIKFIQFNSSIFNTVPNLYFQLENMCTTGRKESSSSHQQQPSEGVPVVIITDVLGIRLGGQLFMPEPIEVLKFLSTFNRHQQYVNFGDGCKRVLVQEAIDVNATTKFKRDGLIVIYRNKEFKFKFPTFDVKLMNGMAYVKNSNNMDDSLNLIHYDNLSDGIYEVSFNNLQAGPSSMCNHLTFLRKRTDRLTPSTRTEVEEAMHELDLMIGCVVKL